MSSAPFIDVRVIRVSERDAVLRERVACAQMRCSVKHEYDRDHPTEKPCAECQRRAVELYPLPKIPRATVVRDPHTPLISWRYIEPATAADPGAALRGFETRDDEGSERFVSIAGSSVTFWPTPRRVQMWAALLAHPVELVDDDGTAGGAS